jgi:sugar lactone lactonase YvrE
MSVVRLLIATVAVLGALFAVAGQAQAATAYEHLGSFASGPGAGDGELDAPKRVAVDSATGNVLVVDQNNDRVQVFAPDASGGAAFLTQFGAGQLDQPYGIAIDQDNGDVFVSSAANNRIVKFTTDGAATPTYTADGGFTSPAQGAGAGEVGSFASPLAFDQDSDRLLVGDTADNDIRRFETDGTPDAYATAFNGADSGTAFTQVKDLAVDDDGDVLVVDGERVERFADDGTHTAALTGTPATPDTVTAVPGTGEVLVGHNGFIFEAAIYRYTGDAYVDTYRPGDGSFDGALGGLAVSAGANQRLYASTGPDANGFGVGVTSVQTYDVFQVQAPIVASTSVDPSEIGAHLSASINPNRVAATYQFEYGETAAYGKRFPLPPGSIPAGANPVTVARTIGGLEPGTTYHYRVVATNAGGTTDGPDQTFTTKTPGSAGEQPGNGRVYEEVTPVNRNGVSPDIRRPVLTTPSGDAVAYSIPGALPNSPTSTIFAWAVARRGDSWDSKSAEVAQTAPDGGIRGKLVKGFSSDLRRVLTLSERALTPGAIEGGSNVYYKDTLTGDVSLAATYADKSFVNDFLSYFAQPVFASSDLSTFALMTNKAIAPGGAPFAQNAFEYRGGAFALAGEVGGAAPAGGSSLEGNGNNALANRMSADGRRLFFYTEENSAQGKLWMREDGVRTVPISVSQRAGEVGVVKRVGFVGANRDGSQVFFKSEDPLTDDSPTGVYGLYRYDVEHDQLTDLTAGAPNPTPGTVYPTGRVYDVTDDGVVYFGFPTGVLPGDPNPYNAIVTSLFVADEAGTRYIGLPDDSLPPAFHTSPNGRYLSFPTNGDAWEYDRIDDQLSCVSCQADSPGGNRPSRFPSPDRIFTQREQTVLDDGRVFYTSEEALAPADTNGRSDVYEWDPDTRRNRLITPGTADSNARLFTVTPDGRSVFFDTDQRLVGQDRDDIPDLYVARAGGGLPSQSAAAGVTTCAGDQCQGPPTVTPAPTNAGSEGVGPGNAQVAPRPALQGGKLSAAQARLLAAGGTVRLKVKVNRAGTVTLRVTARLGGKTRKIAATSAQAQRAGTVSLSLRLSKAASAALRKDRRLSVSLTLRFGLAQARSQSLTLRAEKRAKRASAPATVPAKPKESK